MSQYLITKSPSKSQYIINLVCSFVSYMGPIEQKKNQVYSSTSSAQQKRQLLRHFSFLRVSYTEILFSFPGLLFLLKSQVACSLQLAGQCYLKATNFGLEVLRFKKGEMPCKDWILLVCLILLVSLLNGRVWVSLQQSHINLLPFL